MKHLFLLTILFGAISLAFAQKSSPEKPEQAADILLKTNYGKIYIRLYDETPKHKANFIRLCKEKVIKGTLFHRVIENFMIQGGDPYSKMDEKADSVGEGGPGWDVDAEFVREIWHKRGVIAAAREGDDVNPEKMSSGSQFYIVQGKTFTDEELDQLQERVRKGTGNADFTFTDEQRTYYKTQGGTPWLDMQYTVFGEVIAGMDVVDAIASVETDPENNRPLKPVVIKQAKVLRK